MLVGYVESCGSNREMAVIRAQESRALRSTDALGIGAGYVGSERVSSMSNAVFASTWLTIFRNIWISLTKAARPVLVSEIQLRGRLPTYPFSMLISDASSRTPRCRERFPGVRLRVLCT